jgi:hypothetical protein
MRSRRLELENGPRQGGGRIVAAGDARVHQAALEMPKG